VALFQGDRARELLFPRAARPLRSHCGDVARAAWAGASRIGVDRACATDGSLRRPGGFMSRLRPTGVGAQAPGAPRFGGQAFRYLDEQGVLVGLLLVALLFGFLIGPQFFRPANLELMARQTAIVCIAALGMTMVIVAGGIDLSVG